MKPMNKLIVFFQLVIVLCITDVYSQIQEGVIVFERKTNLFKKFTSQSTQDYIKEENKYRTDKFILYFNDTISVFVPEERYEFDRLSWATNSNTVIQNFSSNISKIIYSFSGAPVPVKDSLIERNWKFTDKSRTICNIECMQAVYEMDDSTRVYAWFTSKITPNIGPESYWGLPGAILGLATEDGSVTYFAKSIDERKVDIEKETPKFNEKKAKSRNEVIAKVKHDYKMEKEIERYIRELFFW